MKKNILILIVLSFLMVGCFTPRFDNNEYLLLVKLNAQAHDVHDSCSRNDIIPKIEKFHKQSTIFNTYTQHTPNNTNTAKIAKIINNNINELHKRFKKGRPSAVYCKLKTKNLIIITKKAMKSVGNKVR